MLKAKIGNAVILGLSEMNLVKLKLGQPIKLNLKDLGFEDREVYIFHGKDEKEMTETLRSLTGPNTEFRDTSQTGDN
jgi:hypothetical protein